MRKSIQDCCESCVYSERVPIAGTHFLECRKNVPSVYEWGVGWPSVNPDWWCGEYRGDWGED